MKPLMRTFLQSLLSRTRIFTSGLLFQIIFTTQASRQTSRSHGIQSKRSDVSVVTPPTPVQITL